MPIITLATICPRTIGQPHCAGAEARASSSVPAPTLSGKRGGACCSGCSGNLGGGVLLSSGNYNFKLPLLSIDALGGIGWSLDRSARLPPSRNSSEKYGSPSCSPMS